MCIRIQIFIYVSYRATYVRSSYVLMLSWCHRRYSRRVISWSHNMVKIPARVHIDAHFNSNGNMRSDSQ